MYSEKKTPDDGQRNCMKHVEFYSKNKFEKFVLLVDFIIRISSDIHISFNFFDDILGKLYGVLSLVIQI